MKSILITFDQAHYEHVVLILEKHACRGFTYLEEVKGRGSSTGVPHYGSHAWPSLSSAIISVVPDESAPAIMADLRALDLSSPKLGLRAFLWSVEEMV